MSSCSNSKPRLHGPWRRTLQWLTSLVILLLPWFSLDGKSLLRIDIDTLSLHLFGQLLRIEELYFVLFFSLGLILLFLLVTLIMGRVWCGWGCPQTTLSDVAEWIARQLGLQLTSQRLLGPWWKRLTAHLVYIGLALLVGANLVWYFIEPQRFFTEMFTGSLHAGAWLLMFITGLTIYLDLAFIRRLMCSEFCPYGRFQTALVDPGTLTLLIPEEEQKRCIECGACVRSCPMEIDIRRGFQVECISCGRCLDACRQVMAKREQNGLISYRFGIEGRGAKALLHPRTLLLSVALLGLSIILAVSIFQRSEASLKVAVSHSAASRLIDNGQQATFFSVWISNRSTKRLVFNLSAIENGSDVPLELKGQVRNLALEGGQNRRYDFVLITPGYEEQTEVTFILHDTHGTMHANSSASVLPIDDRSSP